MFSPMIPGPEIPIPNPHISAEERAAVDLLSEADLRRLIWFPGISRESLFTRCWIAPSRRSADRLQKTDIRSFAGGAR